jgi:two-component system chemotaxis response regulator CheY
MRCLIVEDDAATRKLLQIYLSDYADCSVAANGYEAIRAVRKAFEQDKAYDLICLDIMMPQIDGQQTLKLIRRIEQNHRAKGPHHTKVIMITALDQLRHIREAFQTGCEGYLVKPVRKQELLEKMTKLGLVECSV